MYWVVPILWFCQVLFVNGYAASQHKIRGRTWTSGRRVGDSNNWKWMSSFKLSAPWPAATPSADDGLWRNWYEPTREPNNHEGIENCIEMRPDRGGQWNDHKCHLEKHVICEGVCPGVTTTSTTTTTTTNTTTTMRTSSSSVNLGCYEDKPGRQLSGKWELNLANNSPIACDTYCQGFKYYGLQYWTQCFCGDTLNHSVKKPDSECNAECPGDSSKKCGGTWRQNIYETSTTG